MLKSTGNSIHDVFKLTRYASSSCEVISSLILLLPCHRDVAVVGTDDDNVPYTLDDVTLTIGGVAALVGAMAEEPTSGGEHELE